MSKLLSTRTLEQHPDITDAEALQEAQAWGYSTVEEFLADCLDEDLLDKGE